MCVRKTNDSRYTIIVIVERTLGARAGADLADWQPVTCQVCWLVRRPGGPPRQMLKEGMECRRGPRGPYLGTQGSTCINCLQGPPCYATANEAGLSNEPGTV